MTDDGERPPTELPARPDDYTDTVRTELRAVGRRVDELARRLARLEDHLRLNGRL